MMNCSNTKIDHFAAFVHVRSQGVSFPNVQPFSMMLLEKKGDARGILPPAEDIPFPDEDEVFPNRRVPEEEEYLPDRKDREIEEPEKEIEKPYFPGREENLPDIEEEEFPKTDPD